MDSLGRLNELIENQNDEINLIKNEIKKLVINNEEILKKNFNSKSILVQAAAIAAQFSAPSLSDESTDSDEYSSDSSE